MFRVTHYNSKLGTICSINVPAIKTCREDAPCKKLCYANKGNFKFPKVVKSYEENLRRFLEEPKEAEEDILQQLPYIGFCRIHASGDFVNREYFEMIVRIAKKCKRVKFMAFTKKYELVNDYISEGNTIPSNLKILYSGWNGLEMNNPHNIPTAYVNLKHETDCRIKKSAIPCGGKCDRCFACWNIKKGQQIIFEQH